MLELTANTEEGTRLVELAETLSAEFAATAPQHDREATFPHDSVEALKRAGYFTAPIPAEYGGLGVTSVHDVVVAPSQTARGDASVAIGVNMHLLILLNIVRRWQDAPQVVGPHRHRLADRRPQGVLHRLPGGDCPQHRGDVHR